MNAPDPLVLVLAVARGGVAVDLSRATAEEFMKQWLAAIRS